DDPFARRISDARLVAPVKVGRGAVELGALYGGRGSRDHHPEDQRRQGQALSTAAAGGETERDQQSTNAACAVRLQSADRASRIGARRRHDHAAVPGGAAVVQRLLSKLSKSSVQSRTNCPLS